MTESFGIFDSADGDAREYAASVLCSVLAKLLRDGVVNSDGNELAVAAADPPAMSVVVGTGTALVQGRYYVNDAALTLAIADADASNPRIDRVVLRLNATPGRTIHAVVLTGTPAPSPAAPALTRTSETYEISLAQVLVGAGVTSISSSKITDERASATLCGPAAPAYVPSSQIEVIGDIDADGHQITGLGAPSADADAATKGYADAEIASAIGGFGISQIAIDANKDWGGKAISNIAQVSGPQFLVTASDDEILAESGEWSAPSHGYGLVRSCVVPTRYAPSTIRIKTTCVTSGAYSGAGVQIRVNGDVVASHTLPASTDGTSFSDDVSVDPGDVVEIWIAAYNYDDGAYYSSGRLSSWAVCGVDPFMAWASL